MTATTYDGMTAHEQLTAAQRVLDTHITSSVTGRCSRCGTTAPCWRRESAVSIFSRALGLAGMAGDLARRVVRAERATGRYRPAEEGLG